MIKILIILSVLFFSEFAFAEILLGQAKDSKGNVLYSEKHEITLDKEGLNKYIKVEYTKPGGEVFATMASDFSKNKTVPDTIFEDKRFKSKVVLTLDDSKVTFEQFEGDKSISKKSVDYNESMVASQGFDNFIKINASKIEDKSIGFKFAVLDRKDFYSLTGFKVESESKKIVDYKIRASNWLIRMFTDELKVSYEIESMKLISFAGRSNIVNDDGGSQDVIISYEWRESK